MRSSVMVLALFAVAILLFGCASMEMAKQPPMRGPVQVEIGLDGEGNLTKLAGATSGGTSSVVHMTRKTWHDNGQPKSDTLFTSDPTAVQQQFYAGVLSQSRQDSANFSQALADISGLAKELATLATSLRTAPPAPTSAPTGAKDELQALLLDLLKEKLAKAGNAP